MQSVWAVHATDPSTGGSGAQGHSPVSLRETLQREEEMGAGRKEIVNIHNLRVRELEPEIRDFNGLGKQSQNIGKRKCPSISTLKDKRLMSFL